MTWIVPTDEAVEALARRFANARIDESRLVRLTFRRVTEEEGESLE